MKKERQTEKRMVETLPGLLLPFLGTSLGAACVFFLSGSLSRGLTRALTGFAAGVMVAASVWSLLLPAIERAGSYGRLSFVPAAVGFWGGILFLLLLDRVIPRLYAGARKAEGPRSRLTRVTMTVLAVTLHNIPEGMAVGVAYAGLLSGSPEITAGGAFALAVGIAIQNFPEGAIVSLPLRAAGKPKGRSFLFGVLSGAVEPIFGFLTILAAEAFIPAMPYLLAFASGAMICVVVEELIPEAAAGERADIGVLFFSVGFTLMMILDISLS